MEEILTLSEVAAYLKLSEITVHRLANQGIIPGVKLGKQWRFSKDAIRGLLKKPGLLRRMEETAWKKSPV
jgi:excisionase family DNA binding protein